MFFEPLVPSEAQAQKLQKDLSNTIEEAARKIAGVDVLLLCTGAGFSADSGLATYGQVADITAYKQLGLEYHDLCQMKWLGKNPALFWGFWGQCFNDYRATAPHEGYEIIEKWIERWFRHSRRAEDIRTELKLLAPSGYDWESSVAEPYVVMEHAGAFYAITSNVDAHHYDWFRACEIRECHGNLELYQCATTRARACPGVWRAPTDFHFHVDKSSMLASVCASMESPLTSSAPMVIPLADQPPPEMRSGNLEDFRAHVGHVRIGNRAKKLRHMPPSQVLPGPATTAGFETNHPTCPFCDGPARPAVLMFDDDDWQDVTSQSKRKDSWVLAVYNLISLQTDALKICILEIGAGGNVTTVRNTSERILRSYLEAGAEATLIRVNREMPFGDDPQFAPGGKREQHVLSIMAGGLESLRRIDSSMGNEGE